MECKRSVCLYIYTYIYIKPPINLLFNKEGGVCMADREECTKNTLIYSVSTRFLNLCGFEQETEISTKTLAMVSHTQPYSLQ
jgi:hypothetical protein